VGQPEQHCQAARRARATRPRSQRPRGRVLTMVVDVWWRHDSPAKMQADGFTVPEVGVHEVSTDVVKPADLHRWCQGMPPDGWVLAQSCDNFCDNVRPEFGGTRSSPGVGSRPAPG
jgi:hypothetical protein